MPSQKICMWRLIWNHQGIPVPPVYGGFRDIHIDPEPAWPVGRKGLTLATAWEQLGDGTAGALLSDGDVITDPQDIWEMGAMIEEWPRDVHVAPIRIWPTSTKFGAWVWGHAGEVYSQELQPEEIHLFTFSLTYLPRCLLDACIAGGMAEWVYPNVDKQVSAYARKEGIPIHLVPGAQPKHVNW